MKKLLIVTDAWQPQINGVVRTLQTTIDCIDSTEYKIKIIEPSLFSGFSLPGYREIKICINTFSKMERMMLQYDADYIHIAVEGPLGVAARKVCIKHKLRFTTAYHTKFPEFIHSRLRLPLWISYKWFNWFHAPSSNVMVATDSLAALLRANGFTNKMSKWSRGVDTALFHPFYDGEHVKPYALYVGRVSHEKNIEAFLDAQISMDKVVVGDGPQLNELKSKYPNAHFVGSKSGEELAKYYANATVFAFPSRTDTFGLVMIESLACGVPVAGLTNSSAEDVLNDEVGAVHDDMTIALIQASSKSKISCVNHVIKYYSWEHATRQFLNNLLPAK